MGNGERITMWKLVLFLGVLRIQPGDFAGLDRATYNLSDVDTKYSVELSNSGPVIPGSRVTFKAHLKDKHGLLPSDLVKYKFKWSTTADSIKATIDANKNSTWNRCFNTYISPNVYWVNVDVYKNGTFFEHRVAKKSQTFTITEMLNGNINASQALKYQHKRKGLPMFSTGKNITLKLNLTDSALHQAKLLHECYWYMDDKCIGNTTNSTQLVTNITSGSVGMHNVTAFVKFYGIPDCFNDTLFPSNRNGSFSQQFNFKDPVEVVNVRGKSDVRLHHALSLDVYYSGSPPFNACWSLQPVSNQSQVLNQSCSIEHTENEQNFTIYMNKTSLVPGNYVINITITNDVSLVEKRHYITVSNDPSPYPSPANVLLPVVGGLIAVTVILALGVYVVNKRMAKKNVETANFDFHPPTLPLVDSGKHDITFLEKLKQGLYKIFGDSTHNGLRGRSVQRQDSFQNSYGSCDNSLRACA